MSEVLEFNKRARVRGEAALWLTRLQEGLNAQQRRALTAWLAADSAHESELLELATIWDELEVLTELAPLFEGVPHSPPSRQDPTRSSSTWKPLSVAASIIVTVGIGSYLINDEPNFYSETIVFSDSQSKILQGATSKAHPADTENPIFTTSIGQQRQLTLADGSVATLNTDTQIEVDFSQQQRIIHLLRGEAHFNVFKDPTRPLKVLVSGKFVQAVGTAFSVRKNSGNDIEVAVDEGIVAVYQVKNESEPTLNASLEAGNVLTIKDEHTELTEYDLDEMENRLAWRDGMIVINDETLNYVISEFGRHSELKVLLADKAMGEIRVAGYFRLGDVDALLVALEQNFKIRSEYYQDNKTYVLSQRATPALTTKLGGQ